MKKRKIFAFVLTILVVASAALYLTTFHKQKDVSVSPVKEGTIEIYLNLTGEAVLEESFIPLLPNAGQIEKVNVSVGDVVEEGDVLFETSKEELQKALSKKEKALEEKQEALQSVMGGSQSSLSMEMAIQMAQLSSIDLNSFNEILSSDSSAPTMGNTSPATTDQSSIALMAEIEELKERINQCTVKSDMSGTVISCYIKKGDVVTQQSPTVVVGNLENLEVTVMVNENDLAKLKAGLSCDLEVNGSKQTTTGVVKTIASQLIDINQNGYPAKMAMVTIEPESQLQSVPGGTVNVSIKVDTSDICNYIPIDSVVEGNYVLVVNDEGKIEKRTIKTGLFDDFNIEVLSGLKKGENVILNPSEDLKETMRVNIVD